MTEETIIIVPAESAKTRIDRFLADQLDGISRSRISRALSEGLILVNGKAATPSFRLRGGEEIAIAPEALAEPEAFDPLAPYDFPLTILYEDDDVVVVDKPAGLVVHPAHGHAADTLLNALAAMNIPLATVADPSRPGVVHRLDKDTSGVMMLAKTRAAHLSLVEQFAVHSIERRYLALTCGVPVPATDRIEAAIGRHSRNRKRMSVRRDGKPAITHYSVRSTLPVDEEPWAALVECRLETGRTHQVRVHLSHRGYPLLGDPTYSSRHCRQLSERFPLTGQALHARLLSFDHPTTGERMTFRSPPPAAFQETLTILGLETLD